ncbi:MAG: hypothetical protein ABIJ34_01445 [archaeon]
MDDWQDFKTPPPFTVNELLEPIIMNAKNIAVIGPGASAKWGGPPQDKLLYLLAYLQAKSKHQFDVTIFDVPEDERTAFGKPHLIMQYFGQLNQRKIFYECDFNLVLQDITKTLQRTDLANSFDLALEHCTMPFGLLPEKDVLVNLMTPPERANSWYENISHLVTPGGSFIQFTELSYSEFEDKGLDFKMPNKIASLEAKQLEERCGKYRTSDNDFRARIPISAIAANAGFSFSQDFQLPKAELGDPHVYHEWIKIPQPAGLLPEMLETVCTNNLNNYPCLKNIEEMERFYCEHKSQFFDFNDLLRNLRFDGTYAYIRQDRSACEIHVMRKN